VMAISIVLYLFRTLVQDKARVVLREPEPARAAVTADVAGGE
jgi:hypothetical protein